MSLKMQGNALIHLKSNENQEVHQNYYESNSYCKLMFRFSDSLLYTINALSSKQVMRVKKTNYTGIMKPIRVYGIG